MIYVPDLENYKCVYVRGEGVIRAYRQKPQSNTTVSYRDYYIDSHYTFTDGQQSFSYNPTLPVCLDESNLTNAYYYRHDFCDILLVFLGLIGFCWFFMSKLIKTLFRGYKRV